MGPEADAENRLAKALWELGELGSAREHYQAALALDPTNRIAERNIDRLRTLLVAAGEKTVPAQDGSKAPVRIFVEETGKTGFAHLIDLPDAKKLAQVNPGDSVELTPEGNRLIAFSNGMRIGVVEPRVAARLLKLIADGNKYLAGVTSLGAQDVRIIIREIYQDPRNYGKVSFPTAAKSTDLRPVHQGHAPARGRGARGGPRGRRRGRGDHRPRPRPPARGHHRRGLHRGDRRDRRAVIGSRSGLIAALSPARLAHARRSALASLLGSALRSGRISEPIDQTSAASRTSRASLMSVVDIRARIAATARSVPSGAAGQICASNRPQAVNRSRTMRAASEG